MRQILCGNADLLNVKAFLWEAVLTKREDHTLTFHVHAVLSSNSPFKHHKALININSKRLGFRDSFPHTSYRSKVSRMRVSFHHKIYFM